MMYVQTMRTYYPFPQVKGGLKTPQNGEKFCEVDCGGDFPWFGGSLEVPVALYTVPWSRWRRDLGCPDGSAGGCALRAARSFEGLPYTIAGRGILE
jgi:hypothetical protein